MQHINACSLNRKFPSGSHRWINAWASWARACHGLPQHRCTMQQAMAAWHCLLGAVAAWSVLHMPSGQWFLTPGTYSSMDMRVGVAAAPAQGLGGSASHSCHCSHCAGHGQSLWLQGRMRGGGSGGVGVGRVGLGAPVNLNPPLQSIPQCSAVWMFVSCFGTSDLGRHQGLVIGLNRLLIRSSTMILKFLNSPKHAWIWGWVWA